MSAVTGQPVSELSPTERLLPEYIRLLTVGRDYLPRIEQLFSTLVKTRSIISISARTKSWSSVNEKLQVQRQCRRLPQDVLGIRLIVPDTQDVQPVKEFINSEFSVVNQSDSPRKERYLAVVQLNDQRSRLPEWSRFRAVPLEIQVSTYKADVLATFLHVLLYKTALGTVPPFTIPRIDRSVSLESLITAEKIINDFELLIERPDVHEKRDVHRFLSQNQFLLHPAADEIWSEVAIGFGTEMRADFVIREATGNYIVVELENPHHSLVRSRGDISAAVNHAQQQVEDWQEWIEENIPTVQRYFPGISAPEGLVVIGRAKSLTESQKRKVARRNVNLRGHIKIATYDDLLANARALLKTVRYVLK